MADTPDSDRPIPPAERDDIFYGWLAGAAYTKLLESVQDLDVPHLFATRGHLTFAEVAEALGLAERRGRKWLLLLQRLGLLGVDETGRYHRTELMKAMWGPDGKGGFFFRDITEYCRHVNALPLIEVLRGRPLPAHEVKWPPRTVEAAQHLETWMTISAADALRALDAGAGRQLAEHRRLLDVGGGDATMACDLVGKHEGLHVTVFNLPASAQLARQRVNGVSLGARVAIVEGDFLEDELPSGFDAVLWSRVLADWPPEVARENLRKTFAALEPGGSVYILEPFVDENPDLTVSWEFRYLFYDDFGVNTYKHIDQYTAMLKDLGFGPPTVKDRLADTFYGLITARKPE